MNGNFNLNELVATEVIEETQTTLDFTLEDLTSQYNNQKQETSNATSKLSSAATFKGMDNINEIIAEAMQQVEEFASNGKKEGLINSATSKALAIIDPNNKWAGKFLNNSKSEISKEDIKNTTMKEIADKVITSITKQKEDVQTYMEEVKHLGDTLANSKKYYEDLLDKANKLLPTTEEFTRKRLDTMGLITRLEKSLIQIDNTITSKIRPMLLGASTAINEIDGMIPDIEHDLLVEGGLKTAQKALADYIGMAKTTKQMIERTGDEIRRNVHETTIEAVEMVKDVMVDTERFKRIQQEEAKHMEILNKTMSNTIDHVNKNFNNMQQITLEHKKSKENIVQLMLEE